MRYAIRTLHEVSNLSDLLLSRQLHKSQGHVVIGDNEDHLVRRTISYGICYFAESEAFVLKMIVELIVSIRTFHGDS